MKTVNVLRHDLDHGDGTGRITGSTAYRHHEGAPVWAGMVETEDWLVLEAEDGKLHVFNGRGENGEPLGEPTVIRRADSAS